MDNSRRDGDVTPSLQRLGSVVAKRTGAAVWRAFLVAQISVRDNNNRRREMTTQRIFLTGLPDR